METIELSSIDIRLEHTRCRDSVVERRLLTSIMEQDILDPLEVIACSEGSAYVLVDGFKRYRCARKLSKGIVPIQFIGSDIVEGVSSFLRRSMHRGVSALEEAALVEELHSRCELSIHDIALRISRSPAWVSVRLNMLEGLSDTVRRSIMSGAFPARAYMYGIKGFTRVHRVAESRVDAFVGATRGKALSTRQLLVLSRAFFCGGAGIEQLVLEGDVHKALRIIGGVVDAVADAIPGVDAAQKLLLKDLESALAAMNRITETAGTIPMNIAEVVLRVNYLTNILETRLEQFSTVVKDLNDRTRPPDCGLGAVSPGSESQSHSAAVTP